MSRIATTGDATVWKCDSCGGLGESPNAFLQPPGWWQAAITRRTNASRHAPHGRKRAGQIDACSKECLIDAIHYNNQSLVPEVPE